MIIPSLSSGSAPLSPEQIQQFNTLAVSLNGEQAAWLCGYLSGLSAQGAIGGAAPQAVAPAGSAGVSKPVTVLYGSQTGNGEGVASQLAAALEGKGVTVNLQDMVDYKPQNLKSEQRLAIVVSTHGEGDPPDNAMDLHAFIHGKRAPKVPELEIAVLSLGDSSYEHFCKTGADFDEQLVKLGAARVLDRVDCDVDYDDQAEAWVAQVVEKFGATPAAPTVSVSTPTAPGVAAAPSQYNKKNPFPATLLERVSLNGRGSAKEVVHLELSLEDSGLTYEPGDALGVCAENDAQYADELLVSLGADPNETVSTPHGEKIAREAFLHDYEITTITRPFMKSWEELAQSKSFSDIVNDSDKFHDYTYGREVIDVVKDFPVEGVATQDFLDMLRKMPPRLYSIASSIDAHPEEVHLCVGATRYEAHGRKRLGVCSTYLAERIQEDETIRVYVDPNKNFKLPADPDVPVIMVGPGTGIAPFRAFVEQREIQRASRNWLFFGDQHFDTDFLYQTEWQQWLKSGVLSRMDVAFSRDQKQKLYVQHRMLEQAKSLYGWLEEGAHFYVCGDEKRMAHDVHSALIDIVSDQGAKSKEDAEAYVKAMQKDRRYQRDVY